MKPLWVAMCCSLAISTVHAADGLADQQRAARETSQDSKRLVEVKIGNFRFSPQAITVPVGTRLQWVNQDDAPHVVVGTQPDSPIKSPPLDTDEKYSVVLTKPGTYQYFCSLHPQMTGTVVVR